MLRNRVMLVVSLLVLASMVLAACGPQEVETPDVVVTDVATQEPVDLGRMGAWVDQIVYTEVPDADAAVTQLKADEIDIYAYGVGDPNLYRTVQESPELTYVNSFGGYKDVALNTTVFADPAKLNPFSNPKIREALNYVIDRNYIVSEIMGGLGTPKFFPITAAFPDYARYADVARRLEAQYAPNFDYGKSIIDAEMLAMGATVNADGKWEFNGEPVTLVFLIRIEDERREIGDYVSTLLENCGFVVDRQYKSSRDASAIWARTDPTEGLWHLYTSGWITTAVSRDQSGNFGAFYSGLAFSYPHQQAMTPSEEFYNVMLALWNSDYSNMDERRVLFAQAMELAVQDSARVWLTDDFDFTPMQADVQVAYDLAGGVYGARLYPYTVRFKDVEGGVMRIAQPTVFNDPWNAVGGSNFIYDTMIYRATNDTATVPDPYTGLAWPQRIAGAELVAVEGLPITKTLDWIDLRFEPEIQVPADVWLDWDPVNQKFITAAEKYPEGLTALTKATVYYPDDLWTMQWHDGSNLSPADFVLNIIMTFDLGKPESPVYDEAFASSLEAFLATFKGVRIISTDPLVIETYTDTYGLDAETSISTWWPNYGYGEGAWHAIAMGWKADAAQVLAFSADKSDALGVEWMSYISGPSLDILKGYLDEAQAENFVPYANAMAPYIAEGETAARYANLQAWYAERGHFWIGTGPFYLSGVYPVEATMTVDRNLNYPDPASKWSGFGTPKLAQVEIDGAGQIAIGAEATFDVFVTFGGAAYPADEITGVTYLLYNAKGELVGTGAATLVEDGKYQIVLGADVTGTLEAGANKIEVVVTSLLVSIPTFATFEFVTQ